MIRKIQWDLQLMDEDRGYTMDTEEPNICAIFTKDTEGLVK